MVSPLARMRSGVTGSGSASSRWAAVGAPVASATSAEREPVVLVLMAGDDERQRRGVLRDEVEQDAGIVRGVDE